MRLDIRYLTRFEYAAPVRESANELRACPTSDARQQLVTYRVRTEPSARVLSSVDYWGTRLDTFMVREPHTVLEVVADAIVETQPAPQPTPGVALDALAEPAYVDAHVEHLAPSSHVTWGAGIEDAARRIEAEATEVVGLARAVHDAVADALTYTSGSTYVGVPVEEVLGSGAGVCQDYAHVAVALCRRLGLPARYVSGYLFTADDASGEDAAVDYVRVQTHAWFEAAIPDFGWWALDPTNRQQVSERHVKIGHGRDYDDVVPLKGAFSGPPAHELSVEVEMRRGQMQQSQQ